MTDLNELLRLQKQAKDNGRIARFYFDEGGKMNAVAYLDPFGPGRQRAGTILSLLSFAECERVKTR